MCVWVWTWRWYHIDDTVYKAVQDVKSLWKFSMTIFNLIYAFCVCLFFTVSDTSEYISCYGLRNFADHRGRMVRISFGAQLCSVVVSGWMNGTFSQRNSGRSLRFLLFRNSAEFLRFFDVDFNFSIYNKQIYHLSKYDQSMREGLPKSKKLTWYLINGALENSIELKSKM